ncbi:MAG: nucleoside hydrolase [Bacteroidales bacterium]|nr:nucleoside hydrolase [Bacteroidales bacterium]
MRNTTLFLCGFLLLAIGACCRQTAPYETFWSRQPIPVLVDTDLGNDIDDALALNYLFKEADQGKVRVLGICTHKESPAAMRYADMVCSQCGYPDTRIAGSATPVKMQDYIDYCAKVADYVDTMAVPFPTAKHNYEDGIRMYREVLASAKDGSITMVSLGFGVELNRLLRSGADEFSPLDGRSLVARKVRCLSMMAGSFGAKKRAEFNVVKDIPSMQAVIRDWPTPIVLNPFEIGKQVIFPGEAAYDNLSYGKLTPVTLGYRLYREERYDRPSWDILSMVVLTHPGLFTWSQAGQLSVDDAGFMFFEPGVPSGKKPHYVLSANIDQPQALKQQILEVLCL